MHARREIGKWLNEQPNREIDRQALALLCAEYDLMRQGDTCARMCEATAYRTELRRLQRLIVAYVNASNNDDSADDAFGALVEAAASVPNEHSLPARAEGEASE